MKRVPNDLSFGDYERNDRDEENATKRRDAIERLSGTIGRSQRNAANYPAFGAIDCAEQRALGHVPSASWP